MSLAMRGYAVTVAIFLLVLPLLAACGEEENGGALSNASPTVTDAPRTATVIANSPTSEPTSPASPTPSPTATAASSPVAGMTPTAFFDRIETAIRNGEGVLHTRVEYLSSYQGQEALIWTDETWIDPGRDVARRDFQLAPDANIDIAENLTDILVDGTIYSTTGNEDDVSTRPALTECAGIETDALVVYLVCGLYPFQPSEPEVSVEPDTLYEDQPAIALRYDMVYEQEGQPVPEATPEPQPDVVVARLYIDRETSLPLAWVVDSNTGSGETIGRQALRFESTWVAPDTLPTDYFDPASIGYSDDPMAPVNRANLDAPVLWLGQEFDPEGEFPLIRLAYADPASDVGDDFAYIRMEYYSDDFPDDQNMDTFVDLMLWTPDAWQHFYDDLPGWMPVKLLCAERREVQVEGGTAVIILTHEMGEHRPSQPDGPQSTPQPAPTPIEPTPVPDLSACPDEPYDRFAAIVTFDDVVVTINALDCLYCGPRTFEADAYDTVAGMEAVINGLRRR